jgi:hypothetical protein
MSKTNDKNQKSLDRRRSVRSADVAKKVLEEMEEKLKKQQDDAKGASDN